MTKRAKTFDKVLKEIAVPELKKNGFHFDGSRTFRKKTNDCPTILIINFQLGQRSMEGKFTVNLGVFHEGDFAGIPIDKACEYHCKRDYRTRIGQLIPSKLKSFQAIPFIGWLFGIPDRWWRFSDDKQATAKNISQVMTILKLYGMPWLNFKSNTGG
jgi:hypothetical protein